MRRKQRPQQGGRNEGQGVLLCSLKATVAPSSQPRTLEKQDVVTDRLGPPDTGEALSLPRTSHVGHLGKGVAPPRGSQAAVPVGPDDVNEALAAVSPRDLPLRLPDFHASVSF